MKKVLCIIVSVLLTTIAYSQPVDIVPGSLTESGRFVLGCNYWASHAGTNMWKEWRPEVVEADLKQISEAGMQVIRIFPVWPDFQPIYQFYGDHGSLKEIRFKDGPLPGNGPGMNGVSVEALTHFRQFADLAQKYNIKLIVGLVTGWMSGQLFVPPALEGRKILSDPISIMWQVRFVRTMVREFKDHPAIIAWDLGNECNAMENVENAEVAYVWTASITNAIRAEDKRRPVVSGMHCLTSDSKAKWKIQDQAELTDLLTTHPYPFWTPHTDQDPANTIRTIMHSAAETRFYGDVGGKPCLVEEIGIMGPFEANEKTKTEFLRSVLFNNWANDCHGLLWWCAYDQNLLSFTPYEWYAAERDLGLFMNDRSPKPVVNELKKFKKFLDELPFNVLPERQKEAVCILTDGQDQWGVAYSSFILAKQAGFDIEFQHGDQFLKDASLYLLPSIKGLTFISKDKWLMILDKVKNGATLYVSYDQGFLSHFLNPAGIEVVTSQTRIGQVNFISNDGSVKPFSMNGERKLNIISKGAIVLAHESDGNPVFTECVYGKGRIFFLTFPLEMDMTLKAGSFKEDQNECWKIYKTFSTEVISKNRVVTKTDPLVSLTEHNLSETAKIIILVNCSPDDRSVKLNLKDGWIFEKTLYGELPIKSFAKVKANDACVLQLKKLPTADLQDESKRPCKIA
jgi:beta-galactosidase